MKIVVASIFVEDQEKALKFYTEKLGLVKKRDVSHGQYRWLTVVSADAQNGTELLLEPNNNPAAKTYQKAIFEQGIPATSCVQCPSSYEVFQIRAKLQRSCLGSRGLTCED